MMSDLLLWLYIANAVLLIVHEIDSAYWKEWELFHLPGGITGFLLIHIPLVAIILWGLVLISRNSPAGAYFSLLICVAGLFAFAIHTYFLRKGHSQFDTLCSRGILIAILLVSVIQAIVTVGALCR
jgi:hypothetical protein